MERKSGVVNGGNGITLLTEKTDLCIAKYGCDFDMWKVWWMTQKVVVVGIGQLYYYFSNKRILGTHHKLFLMVKIELHDQLSNRYHPPRYYSNG